MLPEGGVDGDVREVVGYGPLPADGIENAELACPSSLKLPASCAILGRICKSLRAEAARFEKLRVDELVARCLD